MSEIHSRREIMKRITAGSAAALIGVGTSAGQETKAQGAIQVWQTAGPKKLAVEPAIRWKPPRGSAREAVVIDPSRTYQEVLGFGAALTDSACYMLNRLAAPAREKLLREFFGPTEAGFSVCRVCLGASDYATKVYSYDEGEPDPEMKRFSLDHDKQYILPILRQARAVNPDLYLFGSPWSPPGWMKTGGSMLGGSMRKANFAAYARYFVKILQGYAGEGVPLNAVSVQNEVDTDQDGKMPACLWGQEYEMEFVAKHLGPQLAENHIDTKIWILDHNYNLWGRAIAELDDPGVSRYVDGVAWHGYVGQAGSMTRVHEAYPRKHMYWTEGGPDYTEPGYLTDWASWGAQFSDILRNWSRCAVTWNLALDEVGKPNVGPFTCGGVVAINSKTGEISRSGQFWALAHFSRAFPRGARRIESSGEFEGISHVVCRNPDGTTAAIVTNTSGERQLRLRLGGAETELWLPAGSITTLSWKG